MRNKEFKGAPEHVLSPEYWDGHTPGVSCGEDSSLSERYTNAELVKAIPIEFLEMIYFQETLRKFLQTDRAIVKEYKPGEPAGLAKLPRGTIIGFDVEELDDRLFAPFQQRRKLAVVSHRISGGKVRNLTTINAAQVTYDLTKNTLVRSYSGLVIDEVYHPDPGNLIRVKSMQIYKLGKVVLEKEKTVLRVPQVIFRPQLNHM